MKVKFGASLLSWIPPNWTADAGEYAIKKTAENGFDLLEILLPKSMIFDSKTVKTSLQKNNLGVVTAFILPSEAHIPKHPKKALSLLKQALIKTAELDTNLMCGVLHSGIGAFSGKPVTEEELNTIADVIYQTAEEAKRLGIDLAIEPINRYESYVCNTSKNVVDLIERIKADNIFVHLDTFHMNIEEDNFYDPILLAGNKLKHLHMTESNRGMLGEGNVHWDDLFKALKYINFEGNLVLENFSSSVEGMQEAVSLWQPSTYNADDLAIKSLKFMKDRVAKSLFN